MVTDDLRTKKNELLAISRPFYSISVIFWDKIRAKVNVIA